MPPGCWRWAPHLYTGPGCAAWRGGGGIVIIAVNRASLHAAGSINTPPVYSLSACMPSQRCLLPVADCFILSFLYTDNWSISSLIILLRSYPILSSSVLILACLSWIKSGSSALESRSCLQNLFHNTQNVCLSQKTSSQKIFLKQK